jgi:hypothetical protein
MTKLKDILKESVLGELPSSKMFKWNKETGKFDAPGVNESEEIDELGKVHGYRPSEKDVDKKYGVKKSKKNVKEDVISEEYVESMGPEFNKAMNMITMAWQQWKRGPLTEPHMIKPAKKELVKYFESWLK